MSNQKLLALLTRSRAVHERYLFEADGEAIRDDVAEICMAIDDVLSQELRVREAEAACLAEAADLPLERSAA
jgi:hypothetical protein